MYTNLFDEKVCYNMSPEMWTKKSTSLKLQWKMMLYKIGHQDPKLSETRERTKFSNGGFNRKITMSAKNSNPAPLSSLSKGFFLPCHLARLDGVSTLNLTEVLQQPVPMNFKPFIFLSFHSTLLSLAWEECKVVSVIFTTLNGTIVQ